MTFICGIVVCRFYPLTAIIIDGIIYNVLSSCASMKIMIAGMELTLNIFIVAFDLFKFLNSWFETTAYYIVMPVFWHNFCAFHMFADFSIIRIGLRRNTSRRWKWKQRKRKRIPRRKHPRHLQLQNRKTQKRQAWPLLQIQNMISMCFCWGIWVATMKALVCYSHPWTSTSLSFYLFSTSPVLVYEFFVRWLLSVDGDDGLDDDFDKIDATSVSTHVY